MRDEPVPFDPDIAELVHDSLVLCDLDGRIQAWNGAAEALYGWTAAQAVGAVADTLLRTGGDADLAEAHARLIADGFWCGSLARVTSTGVPVMIEARWRLRRSAAGRPIGYVEAARDVGERRRLQQMELRYQLLSANLPIALWQLETRAMTEFYELLHARGVTDLVEHAAANPGFVQQMMAMTVVTGVNREAMRQFGATSADQLLGGMDRFWTDTDSFLHAVNARYRGEESHSGTATLRRLDGGRVDVLFSIGFSRQIAELGINVFGAIDITEQNRALAGLRDSEKRYRKLFDFMPIALWELGDENQAEARALIGDMTAEELRAHAMANPGFLDAMIDRLRVRDANAQAVRLFGGGDKESLLRQIPRLWRDTDFFANAATASIRGERGYSGETVIERLDGTRVPVLVSIAFDLDDPTTLNIVGAIDISEQQRALAALRESESRYRRLFDFMPVALWELDTSAGIAMLDALARNGVNDLHAYMHEHPEFVRKVINSARVTEINEEVMRLFGGTDRADVMARMPGQWVDVEAYVEASRAYRAGSGTYSAETRIEQLDGTMIDAVFSVAFSGDAAQPGKNLVGAIDISERKRAEEALARSELFHRNLFQHMPIALWLVDARALLPELAALRASGVTDLAAYMDANPDFYPHAISLMKVDEVNDRAVRLLGGRSREDLLGRVERFWEGCPDTLRRSLAARFRGEESYAEETRLRRLDGQMVDILLTSAFQPQIANVGLTIVGALDISDRRRTEEMLQRVQADFAHAARVSMLGELAASIAHEVNQPLAAIAGSGEAALRWLSHAEPDLEEVRGLARRITADAHRAAEVIHRVRAMAQRKPTQQESVPLGELVADVMRFLQPELRRRGVTCDVDLPGSPPHVLGDRTQLQQLLANLAMNAAQAMEANDDGDRRLAIEVTDPGPLHARIQVSDKGPGIAPDHLPRLFDRFFSTRESGMGMGLSICQSIVELHGGTIAVENLAPRGARFTIDLPLDTQ